MGKTKPTISKTVRFDPELVEAVEQITNDFSEFTRTALEKYLEEMRHPHRTAENQAPFGVNAQGATRKAIADHEGQGGPPPNAPQKHQTAPPS